MKKIYYRPEMHIVCSGGEAIALDPAVNKDSAGTTLDKLSKESGVTYWNDEDPEDWDE